MWSRQGFACCCEAECSSDAGDDGGTPGAWPAKMYFVLCTLYLVPCTLYPETGPRGLALALRLSEGLGSRQCKRRKAMGRWLLGRLSKPPSSCPRHYARPGCPRRIGSPCRARASLSPCLTASQGCRVPRQIFSGHPRLTCASAPLRSRT